MYTQALYPASAYTYSISSHTFEHPGVKAPGTAKRTPFLPANMSFMFTKVFGVPSCSSNEGRTSPIYIYTITITHIQVQYNLAARITVFLLKIRHENNNNALASPNFRD